MENKVTSEIYEEIDYSCTSKPKLCSDNTVSNFRFDFPPQKSKVDDDGDLVVPRRCDKKYKNVEIEHSRRTALELVGMQMWRGSLLMADWLLSHGQNFSKEEYILELAGGVGFTSIIASMFCPVICTDVDRGNLLKLMNANIKRNEKLVKFPVETLALDFFIQVIPDFIIKNLNKISFIIVAEVIYHDELTDAFIKTVEHLLSIFPSGKKLYMALEKRYVFTIDDCDSVAPCFEYFLRRIAVSKLNFEELPMDFPQFFEYDRVKQLLFSCITLKS